MPTAIVVGATGILGRAIVNEMCRNLTTWPTVHALSRSKKEDYPNTVIHRHIDLLSSADDMAKDLQNVSGEYVFFTAWVNKNSEDENTKANGDMLRNFLDALEKTGAVENLKRVILVTGCKQYGVHLGRPKNPMFESDPWLRDSKWPSNFYYRQQDILHAYCKKHNKEWIVTYPNDVIGFAEGNFMNLTTSIGLYAAVQKELGNDNELEWPGCEKFYTGFDTFTCSKLHAQFCCWAALEPKARNQAFNVTNGDVESWQNLFPKVAQRFGMKVKSDQFTKPATLPSVMKLEKEPPVVEVAVECGLVGRTEQNKVESRIDLVKWSEQKEVREAWKRLAEREGLVKDAFEHATWWFLAFVLGRDFDLVVSMSKARSLGWNGYKDTWESLNEAFDELEINKILPKATK